MDNKGLIGGCAKSGCGYKCCSFGKDGHIVILPKELDSHKNEIAHLQIIEDNYFGGKKVRCVAKDCKMCDNGYKPIMCRAYPLWVKSVRKGFVFHSLKCPLSLSLLSRHKEFVVGLFNDYRAVSVTDLDKFLAKAWVDRYEPMSPICLEGIGKEMIISPLSMANKADVECREKNMGVSEETCAKSEEEDIDKCLCSGCSFTATVNGHMAAYSLAYFTEYGTAYVDKCFVDEAMRGNGLQYILLNANIAALLANDVHEIYSMVSPANKASLKSFTNAGFQILRETKYKGYDRVILKWQL